jgi:Zn-dependent peptidase ImmA (M78 family)
MVKTNSEARQHNTNNRQVEGGLPVQKRHQPSASVLGSLRALIPARGRVTFTESLRIAERQANRLLDLHQVSAGPVPTEIISELPKISVEYTRGLVWGASFWDANQHAWVIHLSHTERPVHNRFTLAHEFKHIVDHGRQGALYRGTKRIDPAAQAEQAADYFAACLLVPRGLLKAAWEDGLQTTGELADLFMVSEYMIGNRLRQNGLVSHHHLRHLPLPLPFIADEEVEPQRDRGEGALPT